MAGFQGKELEDMCANKKLQASEFNYLGKFFKTNQKPRLREFTDEDRYPDIYPYKENEIIIPHFKEAEREYIEKETEFGWEEVLVPLKEDKNLVYKLEEPHGK